jgi:hypothetical protein
MTFLTSWGTVHKRPDHAYRGHFVFPRKAPAVPKGPHAHAVNMNTLLPSAEPPTMQPISQALSTGSLLGSPTTGDEGLWPPELRAKDTCHYRPWSAGH